MANLSCELNEPFKRKGDWWLPGSKNQLRGELVFEPTEELRLHIDGSFFPFSTTINGSYTHSPIGTVTMFEGRAPELIEKVLETIAEELTKGLKMDEGNAFITYVEALRGQVFTGGKVRK